jgi:hypothetical protein
VSIERARQLLGWTPKWSWRSRSSGYSVSVTQPNLISREAL